MQRDSGTAGGWSIPNSKTRKVDRQPPKNLLSFFDKGNATSTSQASSAAPTRAPSPTNASAAVVNLDDDVDNFEAFLADLEQVEASQSLRSSEKDVVPPPRCPPPHSAQGKEGISLPSSQLLKDKDPGEPQHTPVLGEADSEKLLPFPGPTETSTRPRYLRVHNVESDEVAAACGLSLKSAPTDSVKQPFLNPPSKAGTWQKDLQDVTYDMRKKCLSRGLKRPLTCDALFAGLHSESNCWEAELSL